MCLQQGSAFHFHAFNCCKDAHGSEVKVTKVNRTALNAKMDVPLARFGPLLWTRRPRQLPNSLGVRGQPLLCGLWRSAGPTLGNACVWRKASCSLSTATAEPEGATTEPGGAGPLKGTVVKACLGRNFPWCTTQACYVVEHSRGPQATRHLRSAHVTSMHACMPIILIGNTGRRQGKRTVRSIRKRVQFAWLAWGHLGRFPCAVTKCHKG